MRCLQSISLLKVLASPQPTMCTTWTTRREVYFYFYKTPCCEIRRLLPPATRRLCNIQVVFVGALFALVQNGKRGKSLNEFCGGVAWEYHWLAFLYPFLFFFLSPPPIQCKPLHCSSYCLHFSSLVKKILSKRDETNTFTLWLTHTHCRWKFSCRRARMTTASIPFNPPSPFSFFLGWLTVWRINRHTRKRDKDIVHFSSHVSCNCCHSIPTTRWNIPVDLFAERNNRSRTKDTHVQRRRGERTVPMAQNDKIRRHQWHWHRDSGKLNHWLTNYRSQHSTCKERRWRLE